MRTAEIRCSPDTSTTPSRSPNLGSQLEAHGLSWKGYYETLPAPGSKAVVASDPSLGPAYANWPLYASKHSGFMNFASVQRSPAGAAHIVGFDQLSRDLASGHVPAFALVVPNQCNDMHGLDPAHYTGTAALIPADCKYDAIPALVRRGDANIAKIVGAIQRSSVWTSRQNAAIVITFDEGAGDTPEGCCGTDSSSKANFGGGHIPTVVLTNHGPRGVVDNTPYSHYSLLRTLEDAFGIHDYLAHATDASKGVKPMVPLFRGSPSH